MFAIFPDYSLNISTKSEFRWEEKNIVDESCLSLLRLASYTRLGVIETKSYSPF